MAEATPRNAASVKLAIFSLNFPIVARISSFRTVFNDLMKSALWLRHSLTVWRVTPAASPASASDLPAISDNMAKRWGLLNCRGLTDFVARATFPGFRGHFIVPLFGNLCFDIFHFLSRF
jgi:hypothetical protein